jgi:hypothetical protein
MAAQRIVIPYRPRRWAKPFHDSFCRWAAIVLHRRAGKTTAILNHHVRAATDNRWEGQRLRRLAPTLTPAQLNDLLRNRLYGHVMPSYKQAKLVSWDMLKHFSAPIPGIRVNEVELSVTYPTGSRIQLFGADNPDSLRGAAFSGLSFDEYSQHPPNIFGEVLSKALADHLGYGIFAGTIKGKNQLYRAYEAGQGDSNWFTLWQDIDKSLATEEDAAIITLRQAMEDDRDLISKGLMTQEEFDQEWRLSTDAAIKGAFYAKQLADARATNRITRVPFDPMLKVDTDWDLGVRDSTAIWFSQSLRTGEVRLIDYYEAGGEGLPHYVQMLQDKARTLGYVYGEHWAPPDIRVREMSTGKSRLEVARSLGLDFKVTPDIGFTDGIEAVRLFLPRCWFEAQRCEAGIEALTHYRKKWNERLQQFDGSSDKLDHHGSLRMCQGHFGKSPLGGLVVPAFQQ